jgi:hypothetical protein
MTTLHINSSPFEIDHQIHEKIVQKTTTHQTDSDGYVSFYKIPSELKRGIRYQYKTFVNEEQYEEIKKLFTANRLTIASTQYTVITNAELVSDGRLWSSSNIEIYIKGSLAESITF